MVEVGYGIGLFKSGGCVPFDAGGVGKTEIHILAVLGLILSLIPGTAFIRIETILSFVCIPLSFSLFLHFSSLGLTASLFFHL